MPLTGSPDSATPTVTALSGKIGPYRTESRKEADPVSDNWTQHFKWRARPEDGAFPELERKKLRDLVAQTHAQGRRLRLRATPDQPAMWRELQSAGVDLINTDKLEELSRFLRTPGRN